jgi:DNA-binding response OmpR family regulator
MAGDLDGVALARRLRETAPDLPVLLATGYSQAAEQLGAEFSILRKPYQMADLGRAVSALLGRGGAPDPTLVDLASERQARKERKR